MLAGAQPAAGGGAGDGRAGGRTVEVRAGREVTIGAGGLKLRFVAVREDSRCPEGVQCVWAGNARVAVRLSRARGKVATVELNTMTEPREVTYANYVVKLETLAPRPVADGQPKPRDYVATFVVSKKQ